MGHPMESWQGLSSHSEGCALGVKSTGKDKAIKKVRWMRERCFCKFWIIAIEKLKQSEGRGYQPITDFKK